MSDDQIRRLLEALSGAPFKTMAEVDLGSPDDAENVRILAERRRRARELELENNRIIEEREFETDAKRRARAQARENKRIIAARKADAEAEEARRDRTRDDELEDPTTQRDLDLEAERLDATEEGREARDAARQEED